MDARADGSHVQQQRTRLRAVQLQAFGMGVVTAAGAGATAGTLVIPVFGTVFGLLFGVVLGVVPAGIGSVVVVEAMVHRPPPLTDPAAVRRRLRSSVFAYGAVIWLVAYPLLDQLLAQQTILAPVVVVWLAVGLVLAGLLHSTADRLTATYLHHTNQ